MHRFEPPLGLEAVLVVPDAAGDRGGARGAAGERCRSATRSLNVAAAAKLTLGSATGDWELIASGLQDRLHQPYRAHLYPCSAELVELAPQLGALGRRSPAPGRRCCSGTQFEQTGTVMDALRQRTRDWAQVIRAPFESHGAYVREL